MVRYEIALILRVLPKENLKESFKTIAKTILGEGALIRGAKYLGTRQLPFRMKAHKAWFSNGSYVVCDVEAGPQMTSQIMEKLKDEKMLIKSSICKI
jgi:small subunit ribosomal protein S6